MRYLRPRLLLAIPLALAALSPALRTTPAVHADYGRAIYQIAVSANCDNPSVCGTNLGGFWGWGALNADGTGDGEFTGCGHNVAGGGPGLAGAGHTSVNFTWTVAPGSAGPETLYFTSETDTFVGHGTPVSTTITSENVDQGIPLIPGHYNTQEIMGFTAPGVHFMVQVNYIPPK